VCLEWHVHVVSGGYAKAYVNGVEVTSLTTVQDTQPTPNVAQVALGLVATPGTATSAREIWFDDVAIDANPIGCTK
jgi:hypothetical protein